MLKFQQDSFCSGNYFGINLDYVKMKCAAFFFGSITCDSVKCSISNASDFMKFGALLSGS